MFQIIPVAIRTSWSSWRSSLFVCYVSDTLQMALDMAAKGHLVSSVVALLLLVKQQSNNNFRLISILDLSSLLETRPRTSFLHVLAQKFGAFRSSYAQAKDCPKEFAHLVYWERSSLFVLRRWFLELMRRCSLSGVCVLEWTALSLDQLRDSEVHLSDSFSIASSMGSWLWQISHFFWCLSESLRLASPLVSTSSHISHWHVEFYLLYSSSIGHFSCWYIYWVQLADLNAFSQLRFMNLCLAHNREEVVLSQAHVPLLRRSCRCFQDCGTGERYHTSVRIISELDIADTFLGRVFHLRWQYRSILIQPWVYLP